MILYRASFSIPIVTPLLNETLRMHYRDLKKLQLRMAWEVKIAGGSLRPPVPLAQARVTIERHSPGRPDYDNMVGGAKQLVDILLTPRVFPSRTPGKPPQQRHRLGLSFLRDDGPDFLELIVRGVRSSRAAACTVITIEGKAGAIV